MNSSAKRFLLVNPWIYDFSAYDFWMKPLGLLYVGALIRQSSRAEVYLLDCLDRYHPAVQNFSKHKSDGRGPFFKEEVPKPAVVKEVPRKFSRYGLPVDVVKHELNRLPQPDAVVVTCGMTYWYPGVQAIVDLIRQRFGSVPIILGGVYATLSTEHARKTSGVDFVVSGQAERHLSSVLKEAIGDFFPELPSFDQFEKMPLPAYDLLRDKAWLPYLTSRGCPYRCSYCASFKLFPGFHQKSPDLLLDELLQLHRQFGTERFVFYDDALLIHKESHLLLLLEKLISHSAIFSLETPNGLHLGELDRRTATMFKAAGIKSLYLSLESSDDEFIRTKSLKVRPADLITAIEALESAGYQRNECNVYLIAGLPGQKLEQVESSIKHVSGLGAVPRLAYYSPIPGTAEWSAVLEMGLLTEDSDPLLHNKTAFIYLKSGFSPGDIAYLRSLIQKGEQKIYL